MDIKPRTFSMASHTADVAADVYGSNVPDLLVNAAHALNFIVFAKADIRPTTERTVRLQSVDNDTLLIDWLNELIYMLDAEQTIFGEFRVLHHSSGSAEMLCRGETINPVRHRQTREVKAATYHGVHIETDEQGYTARVIFDV
jgi:SHS2 domain-containing protein